MQFPQNYFQNLATGEITDLGETQAPWANTPRGLRLDYANPIEVAGVGKGWLAKGDPTMTVYSDNGQPIATLGNDVTATSKRNAERLQQEHAQLQNERLRKEINAPARVMEPKLVDGQWVFPPSAEYPGGRAMSVEGFRGKATPEDIKQSAQQKAQSNVDLILNDLGQSYQKLSEKGAMISPSQSTLQNVANRARSSWVGQLAGGAIGSEEQTIRDEINSAVPLLMNYIRQATEMGVRGMDTPKELEFYLKAATDPTRSIEANMEALQRLSQAYGLGGFSGGKVRSTDTQRSSTPQVPKIPATPVTQQIRDNGAYVEANGKQYPVIRRNSDGSVMIRDPQTGRTGTMRP